MLESETDKKNIELSKLLYQLRDEFDVERIIGLNVVDLRSSQISNALVGYLTKSAQECGCPQRRAILAIPGNPFPAQTCKEL
jgi:hypothetical protein